MKSHKGAEASLPEYLIDDICTRFEAAWKNALRQELPVPCLDRFLPAQVQSDSKSDGVRRLLVELVAADLEYRWRRSAQKPTDRREAAIDAKVVREARWQTALPARPRVEDYLALYPVLRESPEATKDLIADEYRIRHLHGDRPAHAEYAARWAKLYQELSGLLTRIDREIAQAAAAIPEVRAAETLTNEGTVAAPRARPSVRSHRIGDYELLGELGRGGMGIVYKARQISLNRLVAVKMILSGVLPSQEQISRFRAEAEAAAGLDHPGVVPVYEVGSHAGRHFFSMAYVNGQSLARRLADGPLAPREAAELMLKVADAVTYAHGKGVIHRDLKPANILIDSTGQPRITDFGLAKRLEIDQSLTASGAILGTPAFMPPEQAGGRAERPDARSDVYGLGATLYALVAGRPPFQSDNPTDTLLQVLEQEPVPPRRLNPKVPRDLETICLKCLEKNPQQRYATAAEVAAELTRFLRDEPILARPPGPVARTARWCKRYPAISGLGAAVVALLVVVAIVGMSGYVNTKQALDVAVEREKEAETARGKAQDAEQRERGARQAEAKQRALAEQTLVDMYTEAGLTADQLGRPQEALLWFATAADKAQNDPQRQAANRVRVQNWSRQTFLPVAAHPHPSQTIREIEFAPRGDHLVVTTDREAVVYDVERQRPLRFRSAARARCAVWSQDNGLLAIARNDDTVEILQVPGMDLVARLAGCIGVRHLAFSHDGNLLAIAGEAVRLWDCENKKHLPGQLDHPQSVVRVAFDRGGTRVLTTCADGMVRVFSVEAKAPLFPPVPHQVQSGIRGGNMRYPLFLGEDGVLTCDERGIGRWLSVADGHEIRSIARPSALAMQQSLNGRRFTVCGTNAVAEVWDVCNPNEPVAVLRHPSGVSDTAIGPDDDMILTACSDRQTRLWSVTSGAPILTSILDEASFSRVTFSPCGRYIATAQEDGLVRVWKPPPQRKHDLIADGSGACRVRISSDSQFIVPSKFFGSPSMRRPLKVFESVTGKPASKPCDFPGECVAADISPDNRFVVAVYTGGSSGDALVFWEWRSGLLFPVPLPSWGRDAVYSPDGKTVGVLCSGGEVWTLDATTRQIAHRMKHSGQALLGYREPTSAFIRFAPCGDHFVTLGLGNAACVWERSTGRLRFRVVHQEPIRDASFSRDGALLATASDDNTVQVVNLADGNPAVKALDHPDWVYSVAFDHNDKHLVTACRDGMLRIWDWRTRSVVGPGMDHRDEAFHAVFSRHGPWVFSIGLDRRLRFWEWNSGKPVAAPFELSCRKPRRLVIPSDERHMIVCAFEEGIVERLDVNGMTTDDRKDWSSTNLRTWAELVAGKRVQAAGTIKLSSSEWLDRWDRLRPIIAKSTGTVPSTAGNGETAQAAIKKAPASTVLWKVPVGVSNPFAEWKSEGVETSWKGNALEVRNMVGGNWLRFPTSLSNCGIRARAKKVSGANMNIALRRSERGRYSAAYVNDGFEIVKGAGNSGRTLRRVAAQRDYDDFFLMEFSAIGNTLTLSVDGERILEVEDDEYFEGSPGISVFRGAWLFRDIEILTYPDVTAPSYPSAVRPRLKEPTVLKARRGTGFVGFTNDGRQLITAGDAAEYEPGGIMVWDLGKGEPVEQFDLDSSGYHSGAFSHDGTILALGCRDGYIRILKVDKLGKSSTLGSHSGLIKSVSFDTGGSRIVSGTDEGSIKVWDVAEKKQLQHISVARWDAESRGPMRILNNGVSISPDGKWIAAPAEGDSVKVFDARSGETAFALTGHKGWANGAVFSPNGKLLSVVTTGGPSSQTVGRIGEVVLWSLPTRNKIAELRGHERSVLSSTFRHDGRLLASAGLDGTVRLWDTESGDSVAVLKGSYTGCSVVAFSPDGKRLAAGYSDRTVWIWDVSEFADGGSRPVVRNSTEENGELATPK